MQIIKINILLYTWLIIIPLSAMNNNFLEYLCPCFVYKKERISDEELLLIPNKKLSSHHNNVTYNYTDYNYNNSNNDDLTTSLIEKINEDENSQNISRYEKKLSKKIASSLTTNNSIESFLDIKMLEILIKEYANNTLDSTKIIQLLQSDKNQDRILASKKLYVISINLLITRTNNLTEQLFIFLIALYCLNYSHTEDTKQLIYIQHLQTLLEENYKPAQILTIFLFKRAINPDKDFQKSLLDPINNSYDYLYIKKETFPDNLMQIINKEAILDF